ncbi:hypothetical protein [Leifsonia kafniensis]
MTAERAPVWPASEYLDGSVLSALLDELDGDTCSLTSFVTDFVSLWDTRAQRLTDALAAQLVDEAHVVLLSIRSSAHMIGAVVLEASATAMLDELHRSGIGACEPSISGLLSDGQGSCRALVAVLARLSS